MRLASTARALARRFGVDVQRYSASSSPEARRARILADNRITLVLDVGAHKGEYAEQLRRSGYRGGIVSFEPLTAPYRELSRRAGSDPHWDCRQVALGEAEGPSPMHVAGNSWSSSLLGMAHQHVESDPRSAYVGTETVARARLDSIAPDLIAGGDRVLLKLDVQGYELHVLRGGEGSLAKIQAVEAELSFVALYEGQPLFREIMDYLDEAGFDLVALEPGYSDRRSGHLLQADGIFVRREGERP